MDSINPVKILGLEKEVNGRAHRAAGGALMEDITIKEPAKTSMTRSKGGRMKRAMGGAGKVRKDQYD